MHSIHFLFFFFSAISCLSLCQTRYSCLDVTVDKSPTGPSFQTFAHPSVISGNVPDFYSATNTLGAPLYLPGQFYTAGGQELQLSVHLKRDFSNMVSQIQQWACIFRLPVMHCEKECFSSCSFLHSVFNVLLFCYCHICTFKLMFKQRLFVCFLYRLGLLHLCKAGGLKQPIYCWDC